MNIKKPAAFYIRRIPSPFLNKHNFECEYKYKKHNLI